MTNAKLQKTFNKAMELRALYSIKRVLDYIYENEQTHFQELDEPNDHIFKDIQTAKEWLDEKLTNQNA